jgi:hypothetical protein
VRHRFYHSRISWLQRDLIRALNPYVILGSNPVVNTDPFGDIVTPASTWACLCRDWCTRELPTIGWTLLLPNCPCTIAIQGGIAINPDDHIWNDPKGGDPVYHPGAAFCIRSKNSTGSCKPGQQCCYDSLGALITGGEGAGTPDKVGPDPWWCALWHYGEDVSTYKRCKLGNAIAIYLTCRPPNNANNCPANVKP